MHVAGRFFKKIKESTIVDFLEAMKSELELPRSTPSIVTASSANGTTYYEAYLETADGQILVNIWTKPKYLSCRIKAKKYIPLDWIETFIRRTFRFSRSSEL